MILNLSILKRVKSPPGLVMKKVKLTWESLIYSDAYDIEY
ncbi:MAG: hypothetical protein MAG581_02495 [Deltaproteobacteria bacterium]|jgi:hypothetical protein|nr:hypothetical protein [Deltaproteobacteria bacterium]